MMCHIVCGDEVSKVHCVCVWSVINIYQSLRVFTIYKQLYDSLFPPPSQTGPGCKVGRIKVLMSNNFLSDGSDREREMMQSNVGDKVCYTISPEGVVSSDKFLSV